MTTAFSPVFRAVAALSAVLFFTTLPCPAQHNPARLHGFGPDKTWGIYAGAPEQVVLSGDVDGDGRDDLILFHRSEPGRTGHVDVMLSDGTQFFAPVQWQNFFCIGAEVPLTGDFNGDGLTDIATFVRSTQTGAAEGDVYVGLSTGSSFSAAKWHDYFCVGNEVPLAGDFDGDGDDDIATCTRGASADVFVSLSNGGGFDGTGVLWHDSFCPGSAIPLAGDFNGDGLTDLAAFLRSSVAGQEGDVRVTLSFGDFFPAFFGNVLWHDFFCPGSELPGVADLNADGCADIVTWVPGSEDVYAALSDGAASFLGSGVRWHQSFSMPTGGTLLTGRFNGDACADLLAAGYFPSIFGNFGLPSVALCGAHAEALPSATTTERDRLSTDFGYGTKGVPAQNKPLATRPARDERYLLCVLIAAPAAGSRTAFALTSSQAQMLCFGPAHPNFRAYYDEMSGGKFTWRAANIGGGNGVIGPINVTSPPADTWMFALQNIDSQFNYAQYDFDGDGDVESSELVVLAIDNFTENGAANRQRTITADGKTVRIDVAAAGHRSAFQNPAHELAHSIGADDLYNNNCYASGLTLMSCTAGSVANAYWHLDAWHKMRLGWFTPRVFDVSEYPGGAWISAAQENIYSFYQPPVMLYDARRGTKEHYTVEFRNNTYDDGSDGWAGYDQSAAGRGLGTWYVRARANNELERDELWIAAGPNNVINSTPAGDDLIVGNTLQSGANRILQSTPAGDDGFAGDNTCFLTLTPDNLISRQNTELYSDPAAALLPNWWSKPAPGNPPGDIPAGLTMRTAAFGGGGYVEWGPLFTPWLDEPLFHTLRAGGSYFFGGNLGVRARGAGGTSFATFRQSDGGESTFITEITPGEQQWDGQRAYFRVPYSMPSGDGTIRIYRDASRLLMSNAWPITITNPYHDYLRDFFTAPELAAGTLVDPCADPDRDGLCNAIEFVLTSNPQQGSDGQQYITMSLTGGILNLEWSGLTSASGIFEVTPEFSTDMMSWHPMPAATEFESGSFTFYYSSMSVPGSRYFVRLRVNCPAYNE